MTDEPRLPELFARASELEGEEREKWLADLRAKDPDLAREVEELLPHAPAGEARFNEPAWQRLSGAETEEPARAPERVGRYRILAEIGRGGMGRVFLAEEEGGEFRRRVALKLIDRPGGGEQNVRRFRDEIRILASLEHPGIARFLDGGRTPEGIWFLALEYVEGEDLLAHARRRNLDVGQRLELFTAAIDAVEFAHARGVVHRDLKPGNILVGTDGRPRLLDFGLSKLIDPDAADDATITRTEMRALTPAYASPEQFLGGRATPASDVFALGVVLYELLTGVRPFGAPGKSRHELERAVLESDPDPPSITVRRAMPQPSAVHAERLGRDLDAICLKALRKRPHERYPTAGALAADVRRHRQGLSVEAMRGDRRHRIGRFVRRHRRLLGITSIAAVAVASILIAVRVPWGNGPGADPGEPPPRPFPFSSALPPVEDLERRFAAQPDRVEAGGELALALLAAGRPQEASLVVARLRQIPGEGENALTDYVEATVAMQIDEPQRALVLFTRALNGAIAAARGDLVAQIRAARGRLLSTLGRRDEAHAEMERARIDFEKAGDQESLARVLNDLAVESLQKGDLDEGERLLVGGLAAARAAGVRGSQAAENLAILALVRGRPDLAEPRFREAIEDQRALGDRRRVGEILGGLAGALSDLGRPDEAERSWDEAIRLLRETGDDAQLSAPLYGHAIAAVMDGRLDDIEATADSIQTAAKASGDRVALALAESLRGDLAGARGDLGTARRQFEIARRILDSNGDRDQVADVMLQRALVELRAGNGAEAARAAEGIPEMQPSLEGTSRFVAEAILARTDAAAGRMASARAHLAALGDAAARSPSLVRRTAFLSARGALAVAEDREADARRDLEAAIAAIEPARRTVDLLDLRLDLAALVKRRDRMGGIAAASEIEARARALGLLGVAGRARRLASSAGPA